MDFFSSVFDNQSVTSEDNAQFDFMKQESSQHKENTPTFMNQPPQETQSQSSFLNNLFVNQPSKSKGGNDLSSIPQGPSVDPLNSQNFDLNSLFGTNTNVNQSKNKQSNVIKEVDNEEENESKPQQSKKRMIEDPETDKDIFFKSNSFNKNVPPLTEEKTIPYNPPKLVHFLEEVKPEEKIVKPPQAQSSSSITELKKGLGPDLNGDYGQLNAIVKEKKEKSKCINELMESFEKLYIVTEDCKLNFKAIYRKYLMRYYERLSEMNSLLNVDDAEMTSLISQCEMKLDRLKTKLNACL